MTVFKHHTIETASEPGKQVLEGVQKGYGFIPNLFGYMVESPVTVEAYLHLTKLLDKTSLTPAQAQVAMLAASVVNECSFCTVAHRAIGKLSGASQQTLDALASGAEIEDDSDRALVTIVNAIVTRRGWLQENDLQTFFAAGFEQKHVLDLILCVTIKTLSNYSNHITRPEPNPELLAML
ncbi:MAG: carboxymuconolactone decarboxylase family protein [Endozoicomonas sp.]